MKKNILIIDCHPDAESFNRHLATSYQSGALGADYECKTLAIRDLNFNPNLAHGYRQRTELEPDLIDAWAKILWADHLVWIHPVWWGGLPAQAKGFIDRLFLPGMAFQKKENSLWWDKLLKGKTAHIICTMDQPGWYYRLVYARPSVNQLKKTVLGFCGVKTTKVTSIGPIRLSKQHFRENWLKKMKHYGSKGI